MTKPTHNHMTRDIKPPGQCPGCDNARKDWFKESETKPEPLTDGYGDRLMERVKAEANAHLQASLEEQGRLEWAIFRRSDPADAEPFDEARYSVRESAVTYIKLGFLEAVGKTLEPRARMVGEWVKA